MAINFPDSPANGAVYTYAGKTFIYDTSKSKWTISNISLESVSSDILPDVDSSRSLGSSTKKWKELYLSGNTLFLGDSGSISSGAGGEISLPSIKIGTGSDAVKLQATGGTLKTANATSGTENAKSGTTTVANLTAMQTLASPIQGDIVNVTANNTIYMYTGTGWFKIATVSNESPTAITGVNSSYGLATDGTPTIIDVVSTDPEGATLIYNYSVISGSLTNGGGTTATVAQGSGVNTNRFTITPTQTSGYGGNFNLRFTATDNINVVNSDASFTLSFVVQNSRYTALSVKATATGSNQTFDDASTSNHTITASGSIVASTFSPHRHGGYSLKFENSASDDNNIKFNNISGAGQVETAGEFCVETWVKFTIPTPAAGSPNARIFASDGSGGNASWNLQLFPVYGNNFAGAISIYTNTYVYNADGVASASEIINDGQWHHIAVTRDSSNNLRLFSDGSLVTTVTNTTTFQFEETRLGKRDGGTGNSCYTGEMRDTRVVIGSSVYESAFTPPTEPLTAITNTYLLVGDLTYIKDESTNNFSIHAGTFNNGSNVLLPKKSPISLFDNSAYSEADNGASVKIESSGSNRLTSPITAMGTGDFTISGWVYTIGSNNPDIIFDTRPISADASTGFYFAQYNAGYFYIGTASNNFGPIQGTTNYPKNAWNHFAIVRDSSGNLKMYINGNLEGTDAIGTSKDLTSTDITIGSNRAGSSTCNAYVSDLKIESTAVYTAAFTPSTTPAVSDSNTTFLFNPETSISDLSQRNALICRGDLETSTTQVKFAGTKSIYFAGSDDYIHVPNSGTNSAFSLNSTKFTIEGWFYKETNSGDWDEIISKYRWSSNLSWRLKHNTNGTFTFDYSTSGSNSSSLTSTGTLGTGAWAHVALVANNNLKLYINGVGEVLSASALPAFFDTSYDVLIGALRYDNTNNNDGTKIMEYNGWMQDLRIHNNHAQYTADFTPPTEELEG